MRLPPPSADDVLRLVVATPYIDEPIAGSLRLAEDVEARGRLLEALEACSQQADRALWDRIGLIIEWASLESDANRRATHDKPYSEVKADAAYFAQIAHRARALKRQAEQVTGAHFRKSEDALRS